MELTRVVEAETAKQLELFEAKEITRPDVNIGKWAGLLFSSPWARDLFEVRKIVINTTDDSEASITIVPARDKKRPTTTTYRVFLALIQIWEQSGKPSNGRFKFSARQLAHVLKWRWAGRDTAERIQEQLSILNGTTIDWARSFYAGDVLDTLNEEMSLIDAKSYLKRESMTNREFFFGQHGVRLNPDLVENMLNGKTKPVNYNAFISIRNEGAATLYNLLDNFLVRKNKWERRSLALITEDLEFSGERYQERRHRLAKLKEFVRELDGKELSSGKLSLAYERTVDGEDYKLVARKTPRIEKKRIPPKLANPEDDIPYIVDDIVQGLHDAFRVPIKPDSRKTFAVLARWYDKQILFQALSIVKADMRDTVKSPIKAFMYQVHVMAHERNLPWISPCGPDCKKRPENRKPLFHQK